MKESNKQPLIGTVLAVAAFVLWGLLPVYWKQLKSIPALEILAHRMFWSFILLLGIKICLKNFTALITYFKNPRKLLPFVLGSALLGTNWFTYIFAINTNHIVDASLGYYINPLFSIALGLVFFREKLNPVQWAAILCAVIGVGYMTLQYGSVPWIALVLTFTFGSYGLLKKKTGLGSVDSLFLEMFFLLPLTLVIILPGLINNSSALYGPSLLISFFLIATGAATALPIALFSAGAKRIPLSRIGFIQYLAPTLMLIIGVVTYGEAFTHVHKVSFSFIWFGLFLYTLSHWKIRRRGS